MSNRNEIQPKKDSFHLAFFGSPKPLYSEESFSSKSHWSFLKSNIQLKLVTCHIFSEKISFCTGCNSCQKNYKCVINDSMRNIFQLLEKADSLSLSYPLYFSSMPAHVKVLMDRCQPLFWQSQQGSKSEKQLNISKKAYIIVSGGNDYSSMFKPSLIITKHFLNTIDYKLCLEESLFYCSTDNSYYRKVIES